MATRTATGPVVPTATASTHLRPASGGRIDRGPWADRRAVDEPHVALPYVASGNPAADAMRVWVPTT